ncbi:MAG TPA: hypothetical protein VMW56_11625 [Candidatus Margulisiibacteriota bacterium]|nr:hypothetical protein [Candidatus Margulisiibacteriota bacterium]
MTYDGSPGKTHADYLNCVQGIIKGLVGVGLHNQCSGTVQQYYTTSNCGLSPKLNAVPCVKTSASGKVSCAIKPQTRCPGVACPESTTCEDAADTNFSGSIRSGDSGACVPNLLANGDGTISDLQTGLMWEKKDRAGGLHEAPGQAWPISQPERRLNCELPVQQVVTRA